ncbi:MAG TPA: DUF6766 family protein [Saprospiraceae bacterium]|nr:DUF6766 family protein [Saprospiraceae bacterium]
MAKKHSFIYRNSLSIVMLLLMLIFLIGQFVTGLNEKNEDRIEHHEPPLTPGEYISTGHFIQATFENWESEFLQMSLYVLLTVYLRQKGSSESKSLDKKEEVDREPKARADSPWPVKKGGWWLKLYSYSLTIVLALLFLLSFIMHFLGSLKNYNEEQLEKGKALVSASEFISSSRFWFESFQNWQSEFLAIGAIVLLSIWFRQKGSPESKPVDASYAADAK